jgi:hypothetical protein
MHYFFKKNWKTKRTRSSASGPGKQRPTPDPIKQQPKRVPFFKKKCLMGRTK